MLLVADPVTSAATPLGRWLNGALYGALAACSPRGWDGAAPVQIAVAAALLASLAAPLLDEIAMALWLRTEAGVDMADWHPYPPGAVSWPCRTRAAARRCSWPSLVSAVCALLVSGATVMLRPIQQANRAAEQQTRIEALVPAIPGMADAPGSSRAATPIDRRGRPRGTAAPRRR